MVKTIQKISLITAFTCALFLVFIDDSELETEITYLGLGAFATAIVTAFLEH